MGVSFRKMTGKSMVIKRCVVRFVMRLKPSEVIKLISPGLRKRITPQMGISLRDVNFLYKREILPWFQAEEGRAESSCVGFSSLPLAQNNPSA